MHIPLAEETFTPDPELAGAEPEYMGRGEDGTREVSWVSSDGVTWEDPAGYGRDLARGTTSGGEAAGSGATGAAAALEKKRRLRPTAAPRART